MSRNIKVILINHKFGNFDNTVLPQKHIKTDADNIAELLTKRTKKGLVHILWTNK